MPSIGRTTLVLLLIAQGVASRYDPGVFERVVAVRQRYAQLPAAATDAKRFIALADCSRVGDTVVVCHEASCWEALVADCAGITDGGLRWMLTKGIAGEVDYDTAVETGCVGRRIRVYEVVYRHQYQME